MHPARTSGGDSLSEARWYRVTGLAGSRLLSEPPNPDVSGTFACAYHDGWLRTQHPQPKAPLVDAVVCFTVLPYTLAPHLSLHIPPGTCTAQLHSQHASHLHLTFISPAPHLHCTRPPLHPPLLPVAPLAVRQTADYPSTPIRGREAIDSCDRQVEVVLVVVVVLVRTPLLSSCCRCCNNYHHHQHHHHTTTTRRWGYRSARVRTSSARRCTCTSYPSHLPHTRPTARLQVLE